MIRNGEWGFNLVFSEKMKGEDQEYKGDFLRKKRGENTQEILEKKEEKTREREERKRKRKKETKNKKNLTFS